MNQLDRRNPVPQELNIGLVLLDLLPVVFFSAAAAMFGGWLDSFIFVLGSLVCITAGLTRFAWGLIAVVKKENHIMLKEHFLPMLWTGFGLMAVGVLVKWRSVRFDQVLRMVVDSKFNVLFIVSIVLLALMMLLHKLLDAKKKWVIWIVESTNSLAQIFMFLAVFMMFYINDVHMPGEIAMECLNSPEAGVTVSQDKDWITFTPEQMNDDTVGLIFYPGALVDYRAYAPLMQEFTLRGYYCVLVHMPDNLAFLNTTAAKDVMEAYPAIHTWYLAGHSLGGAMASSYIGNNPDTCGVSKLILLGAYASSNLSDVKISVDCIRGSEDMVMSKETHDEYMCNLPLGAVDYTIGGGCHSYFGDYGPQEGDGTPTITKQEQWEKTVECVCGE